MKKYNGYHLGLCVKLQSIDPTILLANTNIPVYGVAINRDAQHGWLIGENHTETDDLRVSLF